MSILTEGGPPCFRARRILAVKAMKRLERIDVCGYLVGQMIRLLRISEGFHALGDCL